MGIGTKSNGAGDGPAIGPRFADAPVHPAGTPGAKVARALAVIDVAVAELQSNDAAGGVAQVQLDPLPGGLVALVDRLFVSCDSATATTLGVFVGGTSTRQQRDYAPSGNRNVADLTPPIYVGPSQPLILRWEGADDGAHGIATVQYRICTRVDVDPLSIAGQGMI